MAGQPGSIITSPTAVELRPAAAARPTRLRLQELPILPTTVLMLFVLGGAVGPLIAPHDPDLVNLSRSLRPPVFEPGGMWAYPLGTDQLGRDVLSRVVAGARISLLVSLSVVFVSGGIGLTIAMLAGYVGGRLDDFLMRLTDLSLAFPFILVALVIIGIFGASVNNVIIILCLAGWSSYARVIRSEVLRLKTQDFITMAVVMGGGVPWIVRRHLIPNVVPTLLVLATLQVGNAIIAEGSLSFLGIGVPPPTSSWGGMLAAGREYMTTAWWLPVIPGLALSTTVLAANLMGDWLRTRSDPTRRR